MVTRHSTIASTGFKWITVIRTPTISIAKQSSCKCSKVEALMKTSTDSLRSSRTSQHQQVKRSPKATLVTRLKQVLQLNIRSRSPTSWTRWQSRPWARSEWWLVWSTATTQSASSRPSTRWSRPSKFRCPPWMSTQCSVTWFSQILATTVATKAWSCLLIKSQTTLVSHTPLAELSHSTPEWSFVRTWTPSLTSKWTFQKTSTTIKSLEFRLWARLLTHKAIQFLKARKAQSARAIRTIITWASVSALSSLIKLAK